MTNIPEMMSALGSKMRTETFLKSIGLGDFNPDAIRDKAMTKAVEYTVDVLYKEFPKENKMQIFFADPRRSDKEKSIATLISKALPKVLGKMNENDLNMIFYAIQDKKEN